MKNIFSWLKSFFTKAKPKPKKFDCKLDPALKKTLKQLQDDINKSPYKMWFIARACGYKNPNHFSNILASRRRAKNGDYSFIEKARTIINSKPIILN